MNIEMRLETRGGLFDGRAQEIIRKINHRMLTEAAIMVQGEVQQRTPVYTGILRRGIAHKVSPDGTEARVFPGQESAAYAIVMEEGRRPGQTPPPSAPLALWARRKLGLDEDEAKRVGFLIARKIGRLGTRPHHMFGEAVAESESRLQAIIARHQTMLTEALDA